MAKATPLEGRKREILTAIVRTFISTGEPVGSRTVSRRGHGRLSPATIRNVMADLEDEGFLDQPHTSAGRVPTAKAYRFYAEEMGAGTRLSRQEEELIAENLRGGAEGMLERTSHVLSLVTHNLGMVLSPPLARTVLEQVRFVKLAAGQILVVLVSRGHLVHNKVIRVSQDFSRAELDQTANYLSREFAGWTLEAIRLEIQRRMQAERAQYDLLLRNAILLCEQGLLESDRPAEVYVDGAAEIVAQTELADQHRLRELLRALEEKERLVRLLTDCIESPEPWVHVLVGLEKFVPGGKHFALISAPYRVSGQIVGSVGVLGPTRMEYDRAITAVSFVSSLMSEILAEA